MTIKSFLFRRPHTGASKQYSKKKNACTDELGESFTNAARLLADSHETVAQQDAMYSSMERVNVSNLLSHYKEKKDLAEDHKHNIDRQIRALESNEEMTDREICFEQRHRRKLLRSARGSVILPVVAVTIKKDVLPLATLIKALAMAKPVTSILHDHHQLTVLTS